MVEMVRLSTPRVCFEDRVKREKDDSLLLVLSK